MSATKRLIVNADDFGFTHDVNEGIIEAHTKGILTATTLMANGNAFEHAVQLARANPTLDVGCHLVLVGGRSLLIPYRPLPKTVTELMQRLAFGKMRVYEEFSAQIGKLIAAGVYPTHLDTHKHTHLAPPVLSAIARVSADFGIHWVRRPFDLPITAAQGEAPLLKKFTTRGLGVVRAQFHRVLSKQGCRTTDHFAGFQLTGRFKTAELVALIRALPDGLTELMTHPGRCGTELNAAKTRLKQSRQDELEALTSAEAKAALEESGVHVVGYRDL